MRGFLAIIAFGLACAPSWAAIVATVDSPIGTVQISSDVVGEMQSMADGSIRWSGNMSQPNLGWEAEWEYFLGGASSVAGWMVFTNQLAVPTDFTFDISAVSNVTFAEPVLSGASTISVLDTNSDGAAMTAVGDGAIYDAHIMDNSQRQLFADPFGLTAAAFSADGAGEAWGPEAATMGINEGDLFGVDHRFILTPGDQATVNSSFFIAPEPSALLLLGLGATLLRRRRG